jgi:hypothetical protein
MNKYFLTNNNIVETCYFNSDAEALAEAQQRNRYDHTANWKAWNQYGEAIYSVIVLR